MTPATPSPSAALSRRALLRAGSALAATSALADVSRAAPGAGTRPVLVQVFLRGGMDGLTTVVPHGDGALHAARPTLAVPPPGTSGGARDLDGFFGLAPAAAPLLTPWSDGRLAIVHAAGSTDPTRSHFDAFARMEHGDPALPPGLVQGGWLARYLVATGTHASAPLRALAAGDLLPRVLDGAPGALPIPDLDAFAFPGRATTAARRAAVLMQTHASRPAPLGPAALGTLASIARLEGVDFAGHTPANGAQYPGTPFGRRLRDVAALIQADVGVEAITLDLDGWDLHAELGPLTGAMAILLDELARGLEAFYLDMLAYLDRYVLVCLSEFGRRVAENSSAGTDHGHGNALLVMGGGVSGGRVLGAWPGLSADALDNGDLAVTTDYRDVLGEILARRCGITDLAPIFPQHVFHFPGVIA